MSRKPEARAEAARPPEPKGPDPGPGLSSIVGDALTALLLLGSVLAAYLPVWRAGFVWDDDGHVTRADLRPLHGLWRIWFEPGATQQYYPLLHSAFWVEHRLWGDSVLAYHLLNVALHAAAAWLLYVILRGVSFPAPRLAALIFA